MIKETYVKPTADILVIDIDEARMAVIVDSDDIYDGDDDGFGDFEED